MQKMIVQKIVLLLILLFCNSVIAEPPEDPFSKGASPEDPFANSKKDEAFDVESQDITQNIHPSIESRYRIEFKSYFQNNYLHEPHVFNPGIENLFSDSTRFIGLDARVDTNWTSHWHTRIRTFSRYQVENPEIFQAQNTEEMNNQNSWLLEGLVNWQSSDHSLNIELGRIKPQWSNGYNYDIANVLQPQRNRPFINQDDPLQSKGWDMFNLQYIFQRWSLAGYIVKSESPYFDSNFEGVLRIGYQGDNSLSLLLHKIEGSQLVWGATWSRLLNDSTSMRTEWTLHPYRQLEGVAEKDRDYYHRVVVGTTYTSDTGWSLITEYFYNQHGANEYEWRQLTENSAMAAQRLRTESSSNIGGDFNTAFSGLEFMRAGWLRENYLSVSYLSSESEELWQLRLSALLSVDDSSFLSRLEVLKSFNDHLSGRFQLERFDGCDLCEYGISPNNYTARLVISWLF